MEVENLGTRTETTEVSIINRIQEREERTSGVEDTVEKIDTSVKENIKLKKFLTQNTKEIKDTMKDET